MSTEFDKNQSLSNTSHRRLNVLTGEWVLVSAHRSERPWQGQQEHIAEEQKLAYQPECYLCPGNTRVSGHSNPDYKSVYVFKNDHAALLENDSIEFQQDDLLHAKSEAGDCRVICFSPRHDLTLAHMPVSEIAKVVDVWAEQYQEIGKRDDISYVQIFENKGAVMGCSNPHPHGQIWSQESIPDEPRKELKNMRDYYDCHGQTPLLTDYVALELKQAERIVCGNEHFVVLVPYWATWPFELIVLPRQQLSSLLDFSVEQKRALADVISQLNIKYDNLFETSFPYSAGIHQAPVDGRDYPECTFHMHFYPPLLRSASVKKFMVGYEMLGGPQRDITPEKSAQMLKQCSSTHYSKV